MIRPRPRSGWLLGVSVLVGLIGVPSGAMAALGTNVTVSPAVAAPGQIVEVQLRTYLPYEADALDLELPPGYPAPSGLLYVLYPVPDYPFRVTATGPDGTARTLDLTLDPADPTLWRGTLQPDAAGQWLVRVENLTPDTPGASAVLLVVAEPGDPGAPSASPSP